MAQKITPAELKRQKIASWSFTIIGAAVLAFGIYFVIAANANRFWPIAEGKVQYILVKQTRSGSSYSPDFYGQVHYTYAVVGKVYKGKLYSMGDGTRATGLYKDREKARAEAHEIFPLRSKIKVFYDPEQPDSAVLKPGANWGTYWPLIIGFLLFALGVHSVWVSRRMNHSTTLEVSSEK